MDAHHVHSKLLEHNLPIFFLIMSPFRLYLKVSYNIPELFVVQRIRFSPEAVPVQMSYQSKVRFIRCGVHPAAVFQIV